MLFQAIDPVFQYVDSEACSAGLDWIEIAVDTCNQKQRSGQVLRNAAGLLVKIALDAESRGRLVSEEQVHSSKRRFRQREQIVLREMVHTEERILIAEYENYRREFAQRHFEDLPEANRQAMRREKLDQLRSGTAGAIGAGYARHRSRRYDPAGSGHEVGACI